MVNLEEIRPHLKDELTAAKNEPGKYICPLCSSGAHGSGSTAAFSIMANGVQGHCFSCGFHGDIFDLVMARDGLSKAEATKALIAKYKPRELSPFEAARRDFTSYRPAGSAAAEASAAEAPAASPKKDFAAYVAKAHVALPGSEGERYLLGRGFTPETLERFKMGFDPEHYFPVAGASFAAVVFPYDPAGHYCGWRAIPEKFFDKPKAEEAGPEPIFNVGALYSGEPCFVVESQLDAITLEQFGGRAVAIGGTAGKNNLLRQLEKRAPAGPLILCLDYYDREKGQLDQAGRKMTEAIGAALEAKKIFCVDGAAAIMGPKHKDPNEVITADDFDPDEMRRAVDEVAKEAQYQYNQQQEIAEAARAEQTGAGMMASFLAEIQTERYKPEPTGITDIDLALEGGFTRQELVLLGAAPGVGKTALASWIFETMAARGLDCVYLNLEMSRNQMLARSIARITARRGHKYTPKKILRGYTWSPEEREHITAAIAEYEATVAPHMIYNPDGVTNNLDTILEHIEKEAQRAEAAGKPAPFVVLDYLQYVRGGEREDVTETLKRALTALKDFALKHNTVCFLIMATNRDSNKRGAVTMESGRDTSNLEYTGDIVLGLTFTKCLKRKGPDGQKINPKSPDELTKDERRDITLKILKGRGGGTGDYVDLHFDGETMTYTQLYKEFMAVKGEQVGLPDGWAESKEPAGPVYMARGKRK